MCHENVWSVISQHFCSSKFLFYFVFVCVFFHSTVHTHTHFQHVVFVCFVCSLHHFTCYECKWFLLCRTHTHTHQTDSLIFLFSYHAFTKKEIAYVDRSIINVLFLFCFLLDPKISFYTPSFIYSFLFILFFSTFVILSLPLHAFIIFLSLSLVSYYFVFF